MKMGTPKAVQPEGSWAALLAKELAPAKRPAGGKEIDELCAWRKKAGLSSSKTVTKRWASKQVKSGALKIFNFYERNELGKRVLHCCYVPIK